MRAALLRGAALPAVVPHLLHGGANAGHQHGAADHDERAAAARELLEACCPPYP